MTRIGLTLDEHFDLRMKPRTGANRAFHAAANMEWEAMFPMATAAASHHLRSSAHGFHTAILGAMV